MPSIAPSKPTTTTRVARVPYLNSLPFFRGLALGERYELADAVPHRLGELAEAGEILAGPLAVVDAFRLASRFERLGHFGIAVRGRARSVLLFSSKPVRQLDGATIAVTDETVTSVCLLRLLLEQRYRITPASYERRLRAEQRTQHQVVPRDRRQQSEADALLLIGDEALRFKQANTQYPYETDLGFEWWVWQHLPFVFAVWAIRTEAGAQDKKQIESSVAKALARNLTQLPQIAQETSATLGLPADELETYLSNFVYRLGQPEEAGIARFKELVDEHHVL